MLVGWPCCIRVGFVDTIQQYPVILSHHDPHICHGQKIVSINMWCCHPSHHGNPKILDVSENRVDPQAIILLRKRSLSKQRFATLFSDKTRMIDRKGCIKIYHYSNYLHWLQRFPYIHNRWGYDTTTTNIPIEITTFNIIHMFPSFVPI